MKFLANTFVSTALALCTAMHVNAEIRWNTVGGDWDDHSSWTPAAVPGPDDTARIGITNATTGETVEIGLNNNPMVEHMFVENGAILDTANGSLRVREKTTLDGGAAVPTQLSVRPSNNFPLDFKSDWLEINAGAAMELHDHAEVSVGRLFTIAEDGRLSGAGKLTMEPTNESFQGLNNSGVIRADGPLYFETHGHERVVLDGAAGTGVVVAEANNSSIQVDGGEHFGHFDGEMRIGSGNEIRLNFDEPWDLGSGGNLNFINTRRDAPAYLRGNDITVRGNIQVDADASGVVTAKTNFVDTASVDIGDDGQLSLLGAIQVDGGQFSSSPTDDSLIRFMGSTTWAGQVSSSARLSQEGNATVTLPTMVNGGLLDLDGRFENTEWNVLHSLTLNVDSIDAEDTKPNRFHGSMTIGNQIGFGQAQVKMNLPEGSSWGVFGDLELRGNNNFVQTRVSGVPMNLSGSMNVVKKVAVSAEVNFGGGSVTTLAGADEVLRLDGDSQVLSNATFVGNGTLQSEANMVLWGGADLGDVTLENNSQLSLHNGVGVADVGYLRSSFESNLVMSVGVEGEQMVADLLRVDQSAEIGGRLQLTIEKARPYQTVPVISTDNGHVLGQFHTVSWNDVGPDLGLAVTYSGDAVNVTAALLGDADLDGNVAFNDFLTLANNFEPSNVIGDWSAGDFDGDGKVAFLDFLHLANNFGESMNIAEAASVPEPSSLILLVGALWVMPRRRGRRLR